MGQELTRVKVIGDCKEILMSKRYEKRIASILLVLARDMLLSGDSSWDV